MISRIDSYLLMVDIARRPFLDGRIEKHREILEQQKTTLDTAVSTATTKYELEQLAWENHMTNPITPLEAKLDLEQKRLEQIGKSAALSNFSADVKDKLEMLDSLKSRLNEERDYFINYKKNLTVVSPITGMFRPIVLENGFAKRGSTIAEIRI
ncbi:hypothetical protein WJ41_35155 [Burkholderia ubonensis]|nr:hypothetical protein WJ41_35155 [Burkholderia ubonensis]KVT98641.1 hypothetical protein WK61_09430 [Burkholderia ubonensis]